MSELWTVLAVWLGLAAACAITARLKGKSPVLWFFRGIALGALALGYLLLSVDE